MVIIVASQSIIVAKPVEKDKALMVSKSFLKIEQLRGTKKEARLAQEGKKILKSIQKHKIDNTTPIYDEDNQVLAWVTELEPEGYIVTSADDQIKEVISIPIAYIINSQTFLHTKTFH